MPFAAATVDEPRTFAVTQAAQAVQQTPVAGAVAALAAVDQAEPAELRRALTESQADLDRRTCVRVEHTFP